MLKTRVYKVQRTVTMVMETEIVAHSKADAKRLIYEGAGDFDESQSGMISTNKVLYEMDSVAYNQLFELHRGFGLAYHRGQ